MKNSKFTPGPWHIGETIKRLTFGKKTTITTKNDNIKLRAVFKSRIDWTVITLDRDQLDRIVLETLAEWQRLENIKKLLKKTA